MFQSLRIRLALSHTLPLLVILPLLGISLLYLLESRYFFGNLAEELVAQGELIAAFTRDSPDIWQDPAAAKAFLTDLMPLTAARMMLINTEGKMVASSLAEDQDRIGTLVEAEPLPVALQGQTDWRTDNNANLGGRVVDVAVPVIDRQGFLLGVIRLSHSLGEIEARLVPLRWLVIVSLLATAGLGLLLGLVLARSIGTPLIKLDRAIERFTPGTPPGAFPESGAQEIRHLAQTFNQMAQRLHELEQGRQLLVAGLVHELGRPLGAIKAGVQALLDGAVSDPELSIEFADEIDGQVNQIRRVIDDLTLLGEASLPELSLHRKLVDIQEIIQSQCRIHARQAEQKQIELICESEGPYPQLFADPDRLSQILSNLIHNAVKYSQANDRITVRAETEGSLDNPTHLLVEVHDTGPGIDPGEQEKIFDLYYRNPKQKRIHQGMGIGLAVSRRMAEAHGGTLTVESEAGEGATFTLQLPIHSDPDFIPAPDPEKSTNTPPLAP